MPSTRDKIIEMKLLKDVSAKSVAGKTCLVRVDFNVEPEEDAFRLEASLPTLKWLIANGNKVVILSHRGRPDGLEEKLSLREFVPFLKKNLGEDIGFATELSDVAPEGKITLVENLRFWPGEEKDEPEFAARLARMGDFYVNDAFAVSHRNNSSISQLPKLLPSYAGFLLEKEVRVLTDAMKNPKEPLILIFGGAKVSDKLPAVEHLMPKARKVLLGSSALNIKENIPDSEKIIKPVDSVSDGGQALDVGHLTTERYREELAGAGTIIWNGPLGKFEDPKYLKGSEELVKSIIASGAFSIAGGGETTQLIIKLGLRDKFGFLSTGGGAMLDLLAGKDLPGIKALE